MKASKKSFHAWMYGFTYTSDLPSNLCPYFWKLVLAFVLLIPNAIIQLPSIIYNLFSKDLDLADDAGERREWGGILYFCMTVISFYLLATYEWIRAMMECYSYNDRLANIGWLFNALIAVLLFLYIRHRLNEKRRRRHIDKHGVYMPFPEKKPSIIVEFVKAKYNRYCPKIDWD